MLTNTLKTTALAALLGLGVAGTSGTAASAYTIRTRCYDGGDCVRLQCNDFGYDCFRIGYTERYDYDRPYSRTTRTYTYAPDSDDGYYGGNDQDNDQDYSASPYPPPADNDQDYDTSPYPAPPADYDSDYPG